jgi:hypothetical protein
VDPQRGYSAEDQDGRWYSAERGYQEPDWDRRGDPRHQGAPEQQYADGPGYPTDRYGEPEPFRVPGQRAGYPPEGSGYPPEGYGALTDSRLGEGSQLPPLPDSPSGALKVPVSGPPTHAQTEALPHVVSDGVLPPLPGSDPGDDGPGVHHQTESIDRSALRRPAGGPGQLGDGVYRSRRPGTAAALIAVTVLLELVALRVLYFALFTRTTPGGALAGSFVVLGLPMFALGLYGLLGGVAAAPGAGPRVWLKTPLVYLPVALLLFLAAGLAAS